MACKCNAMLLQQAIPMLVLLVSVTLLPLVSSSIVNRLKDDEDFKEFYKYLEQDAVANLSLTIRNRTLFVPTNDAIAKHRGPVNVLYHMLTSAFTKDQLPKSPSTDMNGGVKLYITKNRNGDVYVNNARIIPSLSVEMPGQFGSYQVMHVIDEVLVPLTTKQSASADISTIDAYQFIQQADKLDLGNNTIKSYRRQVLANRKENLYQIKGENTFLIPVDEGFKLSTRSSLVDVKVIDGHVIPNNVIFTAAAPKDNSYTSAAFEDNIKVLINFYKEKNTFMVQSNTNPGDETHKPGFVYVEIVKANIPVSNGVVHLIKRPLMIVDQTVTQFLQGMEQNEQGGALNKFYEVIMDNGGEILAEINQMPEVTIFAPTDEAWEIPSVINIRQNREKMREILKMHIVRDRLTVEKIRQKNMNMIAQIPTASNKTFLYFNINGDGLDRVVTVEGGGVNATIEHPDVSQTNGVVHIIDRVLGVPYTTVLGKIETDPMMSDTFKLGQFSSFNTQLNNTQRRYTYFVPRDKGWQRTELDFPSTHKKLFMPDYSYHSKSILERHLVIADRVFTMNDLVRLTAESDNVVLPTYRDSLHIKVEEESGRYVIIWRYKKINVYRPDVECTNGIIHVIDYPMLEEKDVVVGGGSYQIQYNICILFANIFMIAIARFLF